MTSTIDTDFVVKNGVASFPMKEYPNWYGIEDIGFIWHGEWSDPYIEYKGKQLNSVPIEDSMWSIYCEECKEDGINPDEDEGFSQYMRDNADEVRYLIEVSLALNVR